MNEMIDDPRAQPKVAVAFGEKSYAADPPFSPGVNYPEYRFGEAGVGGTPNHAYHLVREALELLGLDEAHKGTADWNPLSVVVQPSDTVVIKPNFIRNFRETRPDHEDCVVTHGAIIRAAVDLAYIALQGRGRLIVADASQNDADFAALRRIAGLDAIQAFYREQADFNVEVYDLRPERANKIDGVIVGHVKLEGDPAGYARVNLGYDSAFAEINHLCHLLYGSEYDTGELYSHQHDDVHEYMICRTVLEADCVINLPKLKTHKKVGLTVNMKNIVGINGNKNWLPHHREGTPSQGGDQFAADGAIRRIERATVAQFKRVFPVLGPLRPLVAAPIKAFGRKLFGDTNSGTIRSGNWYGNSTTWRMVMDINRTLLYADAEGQLHDRPMRRFFSLIDGIVGGEGNGPLDPVPKPFGAVLAGLNAVAVDSVCARLMGFDVNLLPVIHRAFDPHQMPLARFAYDDILVRSNDERMCGPLHETNDWDEGFEPHFGWRGHIELAPAMSTRPAGGV